MTNNNHESSELNETDLDAPTTDVPVPPDPEALARMHDVDQWISHVWMVRTFLKHSDEAAEDEELAEVHRELYDFMLALGPSLDSKDPVRYFHIARKKLSKLKKATKLFLEIQPDVSGHMNYCMAAKSLAHAVEQIDKMLSSS